MSTTYNMSAKDLFNAKSSSKAVKDYIGVTLSATGYAIVATSDKTTGEIKPVGYIATNEGVFGFTSNVLVDTLDDLGEYMESVNTPVDIQFHENMSNGGKKFYTLEIL